MVSVWVVTDERYLRQHMPSALIEWLIAQGVPTRVLVADDLVAEVGDVVGRGFSGPWTDLAPGDVVVARTRNRFGLALLRDAQRSDVTLCNSWQAIAAVRNKALAAQILARRGVPMPRTFIADQPVSLREVPRGCFPLLLKPHLGDNSRGIVLVHDPSELDDVTWLHGMVLAQQFVDNGSLDLKLYAVGDRVWAVRRMSPLVTGELHPEAEAAEVTPALLDLAKVCGDVFGLELYGIDVLETPAGPLVVDVNDFPNYTGVREAPAAIGTLLGARLRTRVQV